MNSLRLMIAVVGMVAVGAAQPAQAQWYGGYGYGLGYGGHQYSGYYASGVYPYGVGYIGSGYVGPGYRYGYARSYGIGALGYGTGYGIAGPWLVAPSPLYGTTTTIIRGGPSGGVVQYTHNGNGYTYVPGSTYPTVVEQQPTLGLSRTYVVDGPPPVIVESRPQGSASRLPSNTTVRAQSPESRSGGTIKLICPKGAGSSLSYSLNGRIFTIHPGYSQTFKEDRAWTLEFKRGDDDSEIARYDLKAGTYHFAAGANGWELQPGMPLAASTASDLPPAPLPEASPSTPTSTPPSAIPPSALPPAPLP